MGGFWSVSSSWHSVLQSRRLPFLLIKASRTTWRSLGTYLVTQFLGTSPKIHQFCQVQTPFSLPKSSIVSIFPSKIVGKSIISSIFPRKTAPFRSSAVSLFVATGPRRRREAKPGRQSSGSTWRFTKKRRSPSVNQWWKTVNQGYDGDAMGFNGDTLWIFCGF